ncbi:MAG: isoaspartyl peptidase/L-asparaginase [Chitinophagaceae bacterium]
MSQITIAIHGGAGTIEKSMLSPELEKSYLDGLRYALEQGYTILNQGGDAMSAVEMAVIALEDNPLFNAGKGAVFTHQGKHELDASIMNGNTLEAGAVAGVSNIKNPISLAKAILHHSGHVMLASEGAKAFAIQQGIEIVPDDYFYSTYRYEQWQEIKNTSTYQLDHQAKQEHQYSESEKKMGTVGAVALDSFGNLAAATSTGGMTNKKYGRIGDTPVIGSGTYANNKTCAVSCTGHGEYFLRAVVAYDVSCLMEYQQLSLQEACDKVVHKKLLPMGGEGGLIAVDTMGNFSLCFNSPGMYRGVKNNMGINEVAIYGQ